MRVLNGKNKIEALNGASTELSQEKKGDDQIKLKEEYFTKFPNEYIQNNIQKKFGVNRKFYITYILIDKYRSFEDFSWITIQKILDFYGYKATSRKPKAFQEILDVLHYMSINNMIEIHQDLSNLNYDSGIEIKIIPQNFDYSNYFTKITSSQLKAIMLNESTVRKESLLMCFLYINSYIGCRSKKEDDSEIIVNPKEKPEAFWKSIESMSKDLSMSKDTIIQCIDCLTHCTGKAPPILIKKEIGSIQTDQNKPPKNLPNIYVLNKPGYEKELEWALLKILDAYKVTATDEIKFGRKKS